MHLCDLGGPEEEELKKKIQVNGYVVADADVDSCALSSRLEEEDLGLQNPSFRSSSRARIAGGSCCCKSCPAPAAVCGTLLNSSSCI